MEIIIAKPQHIHYAQTISNIISDSARDRGTGIARRTPEYLIQKMNQQNAVIAIENDEFAGFCYIEVWEDEKYLAHSGLIVAPQFRNRGIAKKLKEKVFQLSKDKYPNAKIFGITTSQAVMKINSELGYKPVHFSKLTTDKSFWSGCQTCKNFDVLTRTERKICLCTGMLYEPKTKQNEL